MDLMGYPWTLWDIHGYSTPVERTQVEANSFLSRLGSAMTSLLSSSQGSQVSNMTAVTLDWWMCWKVDSLIGLEDGVTTFLL